MRTPIALMLSAGLMLLGACKEPPQAQADDPSNETGAAMAAEPAATETPAASADKDSAMIDFQAIPTCESMRAELAKGVSPDKLFEQAMPPALIADTVGSIKISDDDMKHLVAFLACSAKAADWDSSVPDAAGNLFASTTHRSNALAALDALAKAEGEDADTAREFAKQMRNYNFGPNG